MVEAVRRRLNPRSVRVGFVVYKVALGQYFLRVLRTYPVNIIQSIFHSQ
jgi:hypothetical protein